MREISPRGGGLSIRGLAGLTLAAPGKALTLRAGLAVLDILLAGCNFTRVCRHAGRTGPITRYGAESVS
ncbi:MAG: hypothetical protein AB1941_30870 [Gemmatimonadota bacterium]